jgi:hypothetical protein
LSVSKNASVAVKLAMLTGSLPELVTVTDCPAEAIPILSFPKLNWLGEKLN